MRIIFHVDMDAFFVSVEELFDPSLRGKAVVVGGNRDERGVVSAASYEARKFGVHSAMPLRTTAKLLPARHLRTRASRPLSRLFASRFEILNTALLPNSKWPCRSTKAYLDLTGSERLHGPPLRAAHLLHEAIKRDTGLNSSIGIASSRLVAKISSDQAKPNGILYVVPGVGARYLAPLEIRRVPGIGKVTEQNLQKVGHPAHRRSGGPRRTEFSSSVSESGDWRWQGSPGEKTPEAGSTPISGSTAILNRSATNTPSMRTPPTSISSRPRFPTFPSRWDGVFATMACLPGLCS